MNEQKNINKTPNHRREVILGGLAAIASLAIAFSPFKSTPEKAANKIKMLSEDGKLVEIDAAAIEMSRKRKVSKEELQDWIKEK